MQASSITVEALRSFLLSLACVDPRSTTPSIPGTVSICPQRKPSRTYTSRALGFLSMHLVKQPLQRLLQQLVLCSLIELAHKVPTCFQGIKAELERRVAQVLPICESATTNRH